MVHTSQVCSEHAAPACLQLIPRGLRALADINAGVSAGGTKYVVFGGEGLEAAADADNGLDKPPCIYVLDIQDLLWRRVQTLADAAGQHPGLRSLHTTAVSWRPL